MNHRDYSRATARFWTGETGQQLRGNAKAQVLAHYLFTCQHSTAIGVYHLPMAYICHDTGLGQGDVTSAFSVLAKYDYAHYDPKAEWVWVPGMAAIQYAADQISPGDKRAKGVERELSTVTHQGFREEFLKRYQGKLCFLVKKMHPENHFEAESVSRETASNTVTVTQAVTVTEQPPLPPTGGVGGERPAPMSTEALTARQRLDEEAMALMVKISAATGEQGGAVYARNSRFVSADGKRVKSFDSIRAPNVTERWLRSTVERMRAEYQTILDGKTQRPVMPWEKYQTREAESA